MDQSQNILSLARDLGIDYGTSDRMSDRLRKIAEAVGMENFNSIYDLDKLEEKLRDLRREKNPNMPHYVNTPANNQSGLDTSNDNQGLRRTGNLRKKAPLDKVSDALSKTGPKGKIAAKGLDKLRDGYNNLKNKNDNTPSALQNVSNKLPSFLNRRNANKKEGEEKSNEEDNPNEDSNASNDTLDSEEEKKGKSKSKLSGIFSLKTKIILIGAIALVFVIIFFVAIQAILTPITSILSIFSLDSWKNEQKEYVYDEDDVERRQANEDYNNAILGSSDGSVKGIVQEYQEKYGVTLDWVMLDTVIEYRYFIIGNDDLYSGAGSDDITEEELEERLEELEKIEENQDGTQEETSSGSDTSSSVDYVNAKKQIKTVAALMIEKDGTSYKSDLKVGGGFYNRLIDSKFLTDYYKDALIDTSYESRKKLVDAIFEQYEFAKEAINKSGSSSAFLSGSIKMYLQTCQTPYSTMKNERGNIVFSNNRNVNAGTSYPQYFELTDYLKGAVEGEIGRGTLKEETKEGVKAFVIATLTYSLGSFYVDFYPRVESINFPSGNCRLVSCDVKNGCTYTTNGSKYGTAYSGTKRFGSGGVHTPWNEKRNAFMDEILNEIFGIVMVKKGVTASTFTSGKQLKGGNYYSNMSLCPGSNCMGAVEALNDARNGMTYDQILNKYYSNFDLINISEGLYYQSNGNYNGQIELNEYFHFHQADYSQNFCAGGTIADSGCSVTATATVISLLTGEKHDPVDINDRLVNERKCGGLFYTFASSAADMFKLNSYTVDKKDETGIKQMISDLATGKTAVVARIAPNEGQGARYNNSNGHFISLLGIRTVNDQTQVLVWDPAGGANRDNVWVDFENDVLKWANDPAFVVISRR